MRREFITTYLPFLKLNSKNGAENIRHDSIAFRNSRKAVQKQLFISFFIFLLLPAVFLPAAALPAAAAEQTALISDQYIIMRDGDVQKLSQGYEVVLKGFGADTALIEFYNNYTSNSLLMGYIVLTEGETVQCYRVFEDENVMILTMTLDKIYLNNSQIIVGFSNVYQYEDVNMQYSQDTEWKLESAVLEDPTIPIPGDAIESNESSMAPEFTADPAHTIILIGLAAFIVIVIGLIFKKK